MIGKFRMEDREWSIGKKVIFQTENKPFAEGCFLCRSS